MEISIADQIALDDALVAPANRLKIGKCNLRLSSDVTSKEATLQVVYDVLKLTPFYKAFQVSADVPEIYMQEFWASAYVHNRSVRFKMNNKKHILNLDQFRDILQICPKVGNKKFEEPPLEKEILAFLAVWSLWRTKEESLMVNVNKLHQHEIICCYHQQNVSMIENKNTKKGNAIYCLRFTKLVIHFVMDKDPSIPRRNKERFLQRRKEVRRKLILMQPLSRLLPTVPKEKKEKKSGKGKQKAKELETISEAVLTEAEQLKIITKRSRKETHSSHASGSGADEGTGVSPGVPDAPDYDSDDVISWRSSEDDQADDKNDDDENAQDDENDDKNDDDESDQDDENDDKNDDDENVQDDDDEAQTESEDVVWLMIYFSKLTLHD
ncbi:hypothetical protein Tco_1217969 [Tanacetum coccineum]